MIGSLDIWTEAKRKHSNSVVLVRKGGFLETFWDDAAILRSVCGSALTSREIKDGHMTIAGFPESQLAENQQKLNEKKWNVVIVGNDG